MNAGGDHPPAVPQAACPPVPSPFDPATHRKTIRHLDLPGHAHELTFSSYQRWALLTDHQVLAMLATSIMRATEGHQYDLLAFVFMPEHVHLLAHPNHGASPIAALLYAIKRPFSFRVKQLLQQCNDPMLHRLTIRDRPGKASFRFWQEGPGYDRNVTDPSVLARMIDYIHHNPVRRGLCAVAADYAWSSWRAYHPSEMPVDPRHPLVRVSSCS